MYSDFDRIIDRRNTDCCKFDTVAAAGHPQDILPLWIADMDFQAPICVRQALQKAIDHGIFGYGILGDRYFPAVQSWFAKQFDWTIEKDWLLTTPGVVFALSAAIRAATEPGDAVLIQPPVYYPFYNVIAQNGRTLVENPLIYRDGRYLVDFEDLENKIRSHNVKLMILCSPHNPVCRVWTLQELQTLGRICEKYGVTVLSDEIHCDFAFPEYPHTPFIKACPQLQQQTILCTAPSKSFNIAGMQVSNIFIPGEDLRARFQKELDICAYHGPNYLGMIACRAAYEGGEQWLSDCKAYIRENLNYVRAFLKEKLPAIKLVEPEGTYFAWLDCSGLGMTKEELDDFMIHKAKLWLDTGSIFGNCAAQFQRVVLACPRATLEEAMHRLEAALNK